MRRKINLTNPTAAPYSSDSVFSVYCERKNGVDDGSAINRKLCGEDGYPIATDNMLLVADGVGSGNKRHGFIGASNNEQLIAKAFGELDEQVRDYALNYCFAATPPDCFYSFAPTNDGVYTDEDAQQHSFANSQEGLKKRSSSHLASRLFSIAAYKWYNEYLNANNVTAVADWQEDVARQFVQGLQDYLTVELKSRLFGGSNPVFTYDDPILSLQTDMMQDYLLASTLCACFFAEDKPTNKEVTALVVWSGDAHCYRIDPTEGVKCVMEENADVFGAMTSFLGYARLTKRMRNTLYYKVIKVAKPCAFLCATDGIFDTCLLPSGTAHPTHDSTDFAFQLKLLNALRDCRSADDIRYTLAYTFYYGLEDWKRSRNLTDVTPQERGVKRDDSGAAAMKCFWTPQVKSFPAMLSRPTLLEKVLMLNNEEKCDVSAPFFSLTTTNESAGAINQILDAVALNESKKLQLQVQELTVYNQQRALYEEENANIAQLQGDIAQINADIAALNQDMARNQSLLASAEKNKSLVSKELNECNNKIKTLTNRLKDLTQKLNEVSNKDDEFAPVVSNNGIQSQQEDNLKLLGSLFENYNKWVQHCIKRLQNEVKPYTWLLRNADKASALKKHLYVVLEDTKKQFSNLTNKNYNSGSSTAIVTRFTTATSNFDAALSGLEAEGQAPENAYDDLIDGSKSWGNRAIDLAKLISEKRKAISQKAADAQEKERRKYQRDIDSVEDSISEAKVAIEAKKTRIKTIEGQIKHYEVEDKKYVGEVKAAHSRIKEKEEEIAKLQKHVMPQSPKGRMLLRNFIVNRFSEALKLIEQDALKAEVPADYTIWGLSGKSVLLRVKRKMDVNVIHQFFLYEEDKQTIRRDVLGKLIEQYLSLRLGDATLPQEGLNAKESIICDKNDYELIETCVNVPEVNNVLDDLSTVFSRSRKVSDGEKISDLYNFIEYDFHYIPHPDVEGMYLPSPCRGARNVGLIKQLEATATSQLNNLWARWAVCAPWKEDFIVYTDRSKCILRAENIGQYYLQDNKEKTRYTAAQLLANGWAKLLDKA